MRVARLNVARLSGLHCIQNSPNGFLSLSIKTEMVAAAAAAATDSGTFHPWEGCCCCCNGTAAAAAAAPGWSGMGSGGLAAAGDEGKTAAFSIFYRPLLQMAIRSDICPQNKKKYTISIITNPARSF